MCLRDGFVGVSLAGWDSRGGGVAAGGQDSYAGIVAAVEFVESDLPGGDTIDLAVASDDRKVSSSTTEHILDSAVVVPL